MAIVTDITYTAVFPFGGSGGGALGFAAAEARLLSSSATFEILGSIDSDEVACADFEAFTGSPAWCADVEDITPEGLREHYGPVAPDVVFMSPPCKGSSRLLSSAKAATPKYRAMNRLALVWTRAMLAAWKIPPALLLLENVPGLPSRAAGMLEELREELTKAGYLIHEEDHDCGELGELAQHRRRYLLVARRPDLCTSLLYQPRKRKVRAVGEVLSKLPMPGTVAARRWGKLHQMPRITWRNWLRLAMIPAGGDWRDLKGVLAGRERREVFRRLAVQSWDEPHPTVTGPGGNAVEKVADPRAGWYAGAYGILPWESTAGTITGGAPSPSKGRFSVADVRVPEGADWHHNKLAVTGWDAPGQTVIGKPQPSSGGSSIADIRVGSAFAGSYGVTPWESPSGTVTGAHGLASGGTSVSDIRVSRAYDAGYGVLGWDEPARTIARKNAVGCGAYAVADVREREFEETVRIMTLDEALALELDPNKPPPFIPVIIAEDGSWHRPMTPREMSALQGYPLELDGKPIPWSGTRTQACEHIGNSVPPPAAKAIAERMLFALLETSLGGWSLSGPDTPVWVEHFAMFLHGDHAYDLPHTTPSTRADRRAPRGRALTMPQEPARRRRLQPRAPLRHHRPGRGRELRLQLRTQPPPARRVRWEPSVPACVRGSLHSRRGRGDAAPARAVRYRRRTRPREDELDDAS